MQNINVQLDHEKELMSEQVMFMQNDWKREQEQAVVLQKDLQYKEDQMARIQEMNIGQAAVISQLNQ